MFVENYVALAREYISECDKNISIVQAISQIILESDKREFFLKLVSAPEKAVFIPLESEVEKIKSDELFGTFRALVKCANCGVFEKSEKQFQKCSRCGFVFYCSKVCQRNDWQKHKQICKEIRKQN